MVKEPAVNTSYMQRMNRLKVLRYIKDNPGSARCTISEETGLSLGAVTNLTGFLLKQGLISENGYIAEDRVGRKRIKLNFNWEAIKIVCVFIRENNAGIYLTDLSGKIIRSKSVNTDKKNIEKTLEEICKIIVAINEKIVAVGISLSALVLDEGRKTVSSSLGFNNVNIKDIMEDNCGYPVFVDNISISKALGCINKSAHLEKSKVIFADVEDGFSGVYINKGEVVRDVPLEIGYTSLEPKGEKSGCKNTVCLESVISNEDKRDDLGEYIGTGFANLINIFAPEILISNANLESEKDKILKVIEKRAHPFFMENLTISFVSFGEEIIVEGIAKGLWNYIFSTDFKNPII